MSGARVIQINPQDRVYFYPGMMEMFFLHDKFVAAQPAYTHAFMKEGWHEIKYFYDPRDGNVWAKRVIPEAPSPRHYYMEAEKDDYWSLLTPWEWNNLNVLGPNVMAMLVLKLTEEKESEKDHRRF